MTGPTDGDPPSDALRVAALNATDEERYLAGEREESQASDPVPWIATYNELVRYKEALLLTSQGQIASMQREEARSESLQIDELLIRNQLSRYRRRLDYWTRRGRDLQAR